MPGLIPHLLGIELIQGERVVVVHVPRARRRSSQEHVGVVVAMHVATGRMGQPGKNGEVLTEGFQWLHALGQGVVPALPVREPGPVLMGWIIGARHGHPIREVKTGQPPGWMGLTLSQGFHSREGFKKWEGQCPASAAKKSTAIQAVPRKMKGGVHGDKKSSLVPISWISEASPSPC